MTIGGQQEEACAWPGVAQHGQGGMARVLWLHPRLHPGEGTGWGGTSQPRSDDRQQRPARSKPAADGLFCRTEEGLCWQMSL